MTYKRRVLSPCRQSFLRNKPHGVLWRERRGWGVTACSSPSAYTPAVRPDGERGQARALARAAPLRPRARPVSDPGREGRHEVGRLLHRQIVPPRQGRLPDDFPDSSRPPSPPIRASRPLSATRPRPSSVRVHRRPRPRPPSTRVHRRPRPPSARAHRRPRPPSARAHPQPL
jgi:hypothetical protein